MGGTRTRNTCELLLVTYIDISTVRRWYEFVIVCVLQSINDYRLALLVLIILLDFDLLRLTLTLPGPRN